MNTLLHVQCLELSSVSIFQSLALASQSRMVYIGNCHLQTTYGFRSSAWTFLKNIWVNLTSLCLTSLIKIWFFNEKWTLVSFHRRISLLWNSNISAYKADNILARDARLIYVSVSQWMRKYLVLLIWFPGSLYRSFLNPYHSSYSNMV